MHFELEQGLIALGIDPETPPNQEQWEQLCEQISQTYESSERDRYLLEKTLHTMKLSAKRHEQKMSEERDNAKTILSSIGDGIIVVDRYGRIERANETCCELFHVEDMQELKNRRIYEILDIVGCEDEASFTARIDQGAWRDDNAAILHEGAERLDVSCSFNPVLDHGPATRVVCSIRDMREQKSHERELQRLHDEMQEARDLAVAANEAKTTFLANISHELRTPLNTIIGYAELVQEELETNISDEVMRLVMDLSRIQGAARHLLALINDLLDLNKIEAGHIQLYWERVEIEDLFQEVRTMFASIARDRNNNLTFSNQNPGQQLRADRTRLKQILVNLVSNACKFTQNGGVQIVSYRQETAYGAHLVLEVQDSGIGMDKKAIRKLFEPFVQADASTTRNYGGTGLGLTITRQLTRFMGGSIQVESSPGQGTTFKLHFPLFEDTTDDFDPMTQQIVLLIEDDPMIQDLVRRQLSHTSYRVVVADNGKEGLLMAQSLEPQAIILDVIMPQMDGWTTLKNIRQHPKLAQIPILMVSGQEAMPEDHLLALRVDDFLLKPIQRDTLIAALERLLAPSIPGPHDILVIDDNPDVRNIVRRSLEREGWSIAEAENGKQGLEMLQEAKYDLILLDLLMPEMDGFTFLAHAQPKYPQIPIVVLTAKELTMDERRLLAKNTASLLQKGRTTGKDIQNILATLLRS